MKWFRADKLAKGRTPAGDEHWSRRMPERITFGAAVASPGVLNPAAKVDEAKVREIRRLYDAKEASVPQLGRIFGISKVQALNIAKRIAWPHVR